MGVNFFIRKKTIPGGALVGANKEAVKMAKLGNFGQTEGKSKTKLLN